MNNHFARLLLVLPLLTLAACGDEWVAQPYKGFPYGGQRTAGTGVIYVRANMAQEKGPKIEAMTEQAKPVVMPAEDADQLFHKAQMKK